MKKFILGILLVAFGFLISSAVAVKADAPDLSGSISAAYDANTGQLTTSGNYAWNGCDVHNNDKYVGYAVFINGGTPANNDANALDGSGVHIANSGNPCTVSPGTWSDSHTLAQAPTSVCVVFYDVRKDHNGAFVSSGNHSNVGAGTDYNSDNSWDNGTPGHKQTYPSGSCTTASITPTQNLGSVNICHATGSNTNPYESQSPNIQNDGSLTGGHLNHTGPIWFSGITVAWGDIIPAYTSGSFNYPGLNWTIDGQAILNNGCKPVRDVCANIDGVQSIVPDGDYQSDGNCLPKTHVCTDPTATNYDSNVDTTEIADDKVCTYAGVTPTPTQTSNNGGGDTHGDGLSDGRSDGLSSCPSCTQAPSQAVLGASTGPAVLGASTMAGTGTFENTVMNFMLAAGIVVLALGAKKYAKESK